MNFADARAIDPLHWALDERSKAVDERGVSAEAERTLTEMRVIWDEVRARLVLEQARQKKYADRKRREVKYEVGDSVYLSTRNLRAYGGKLLAKWTGPYLVTEVLDGGVSVMLDLRDELGKRVHASFHVSLLKPYVVSELDWPGRQQHHRPPPELVDGESEWEVEEVTGKEGACGEAQSDGDEGGASEGEWRATAETAATTDSDTHGGRACSVVRAEVEGLGREDVAAGE